MNKCAQPILKWAGGKRNLLSQMIQFFPTEYGTYIEPFLGGASVLLALKPQEAIVNDYNDELINLYLVVKNNPQELILSLKEHERLHSTEHYYRVRELDRGNDYNRLSDYEKASRIVYLNHTCYNGLYRVSSNGFFNTPIGKYKNPKICDVENIWLFHEYLNDNKVSIKCGDYKKVLKLAKSGDFVYLDPPYDPITESASFTMYTKSGFGKNEQIELKAQCDKLSKNEVLFVQSNSDTPFIRELYKNYRIEVISANRNINSKSSGRKKLNEVLIMNY